MYTDETVYWFYLVQLFPRKKNETRIVSDLTEWYPRLQYYDVQTLEYRYISKFNFESITFDVTYIFLYKR
jgi:hypothetical protein